MTVEQQSGRAIVILTLVVFVVVSLVMLAWDPLTNGAIVLAVHLPRLGLVIVLFVWLLRGSPAAKWILVCFLAFVGGSGLFASYSGGTGSIGAAILGLVHLVLATMLATSSSINTYLDYARARASRQ